MTTIELFSGLGGMTQGAEEAGVEVALAFNHNADAVRWGEANHPRTRYVRQDLLAVDMRTLPDCSLFLAAPSCKDDSTAGQPARKGKGGSHSPDPLALAAKRTLDRNTAWATLAACDAKRPPVVVVENVPQFTKRPTFPGWLLSLQGIGYHTAWGFLNAKDFGGAVDRPRFILVGSLREAVTLPVGTSSPQAMGACLDLRPRSELLWHDVRKDSERMRWRIKKAQREAGRLCFWNNVSESRGRTFDEPFPSLTCKSYSQFNVLDGNRRRTLTPRELANAMGFPRDYQIPPQRAIAGELLGNALHVDLAREVVRHVA